MARRDYVDDPDAPKANSLVPTVTVAARDALGRLLVVHKIDHDSWALPGGAVDLGESVAEAAVREVVEETGVTVEVTGLVGIYSDPRHVMAYDDGEVRQQFSICLSARHVTGEPRPDGTEVRAARWVDAAELAGLKVHSSMRSRIDDALSGRAEPRIA
jgi:ADP-ribose pyrophosphatase YjhB (NUDIX family)